MICYTANLQCKRMRYIRWMLHLNFYTRAGLRMRKVIAKQLMYSSSCSIGLSSLASGLVDKFRALDLRPCVLFLSTRPEARAMLHVKPYITIFDRLNTGFIS